MCFILLRFSPGASGNIGSEAAEAFASKRVQLVLVGRSEEKLKQTLLRCQNAGAKDGDVITISCDVTNQAEVDSMIEKTVKTFGGIDVLVSGRFGLFIPLFCCPGLIARTLYVILPNAGQQRRNSPPGEVSRNQEPRLRRRVQDQCVRPIQRG